MRKIPIFIASVSMMLLFSQCKKSASCSSLTDDQIIMDGKTYVIYPDNGDFCAQTDHNGAMWFTNSRTIYDGKALTPGVSANVPTINITLSSVPANGTTASYTLDDGLWQLGSSAAPAGLATFRMNNYYDASNQQQQYWFSDAQSGSIQASADANGNITISFTEIKLVMSGGSVNDRKSICGKNISCH